VHSAEDLTKASFSFTVGGEKATFDDVFPGFEKRDRLGVVVRRPCGGVGASALILATITAFYDFQREKSEDFFLYPDYFLFHVGEYMGDHQMLDIFPSHKEVMVEDNAERMLQEINDRGITRLLVEDTRPGDPEFSAETLGSVHLRTALAYSPTGRVEAADVSVSGNEATESYVSDVFNYSKDLVDPEAIESIRASRRSLFDGRTPVETYHQISVDEALGMLESTKVAEALR
jgi:hypothetical protein